MPFDDNLDKMLQPVTIGEFQGELQRINQRFTEMEQWMGRFMAQTSERFDRVDKRFDRIEKVLTKICAKLEIPYEEEESVQ
jgi:hypothetical protein